MKNFKQLAEELKEKFRHSCFHFNFSFENGINALAQFLDDRGEKVYGTPIGKDIVNLVDKVVPQQPKKKPSELIEKLINDTDFDYRDSCGANNCECYNNDVKIDAIIKVLDKLND